MKEKALVTDESYPLFEALIQIYISSSSFLRSRESLEEVLGNGATTPWGQKMRLSQGFVCQFFRCLMPLFFSGGSNFSHWRGRQPHNLPVVRENTWNWKKVWRRGGVQWGAVSPSIPPPPQCLSNQKLATLRFCIAARYKMARHLTEKYLFLSIPVVILSQHFSIVTEM